MVDIDGMVGRLMQLVQDAHLATALRSGCEDSIPEVILRHHLRTAEGEQHASPTDAFKGFDIESCIALQRIVQGSPMLGKGWRVENDEVVGVVGLIKELEGIVAESLMTLIVREIQLYVGIGQFDSLGAAIHRMNECGSATHGVDRESSRIAEHVEHFLAAGVLLEQLPVVALVQVHVAALHA